MHIFIYLLLINKTSETMTISYTSWHLIVNIKKIDVFCWF